MRPGTLHAVTTPEPTLVYGEYFLCSTLVKDSVLGIFHTLITEGDLTNVEPRLETRILLAEMMILWHECLSTSE